MYLQKGIKIKNVGEKIIVVWKVTYEQSRIL
jgi:hypothetical protein